MSPKKTAKPDPAPFFEKLGSFYLGKEYDVAEQRIRDELLLYDAKDLTTNAVCVGMTGSGKTGLCLSLLEEAAIDGIPTLAIDPKGDLGNLLLGFPELRGADFRPWIDEAEASRQGSTPDVFAAETAEKWRKGLADWGQDGERIRRFQEAADLAIYTPGSSAGLPITVLRSFAAPPRELISDIDAFRDRVASTVSGLLALLGVEADPFRSREHILLSNILAAAWEAGNDMDLASLIHAIQNPGFEKIGVMDLDSFYPPSDRFELSMRLNSLLASPGFSAWMEGEPLEIPRLLWTPEGKPRVSVLSIAHLSEAERMFFVTTLLGEVLSWIRTQPGTGSLRAILYMDEVFGYFPPTANPPSKKPMLTLLKQARAYGVGVVLTTQNPVDLDYKGLSNTGTWFLGRLQTERDKARVLEGLEGASLESGSAFDRKRMDTLLSGLKGRVFLLHNVHEKEPVLFHTRWALSYLRGPLTRVQIAELMGPRKAAAGDGPRTGPAAAAGTAPGTASPAKSVPAGVRPVVPPGISEFFLPLRGALPAGAALTYRPALLGKASLHFVRARGKVDHWNEVAVLVPLQGDPASNPWDEGEEVTGPDRLDLRSEAEPGAGFAEAPGDALDPKSYSTWGKKLVSHLYRNSTLSLWTSSDPKMTSEPGESERDFRVRVAQGAREDRDLAVAKLEKKYKPKLEGIRDRIRNAESRLEREQEQYRQQQLSSAVSLGATVLGALFGRKATSVGTVGRASTTVNRMGRAAKEKADIARAREEIEVQNRKLLELDAELRDQVAALRGPSDPAALDIDEEKIRPRKSDMTDAAVSLVWLPWWTTAAGETKPGFDLGSR